MVPYVHEGPVLHVGAVCVCVCVVLCVVSWRVVPGWDKMEYLTKDVLACLRFHLDY